MKKATFLFVLFFLSFSTYSQWTQIGLDIDGEAGGDYSGIELSCSDDGLTVAIGAPFNEGPGGGIWFAGHVRVYEYSGGVWVQKGSDIDGVASTDYCGYAVSLSADGNTLAVGSYQYDGSAGSNSGGVKVYSFSSGDWTQLGSTLEGEGSSDWFGRSVSLSEDGTIVAVGAPRADGGASESGDVEVYEYVSGAWTQLGTDVNGANTNDQFGFSVSLSNDGTILAVGAHLQEGPGTDAGHASVYEFAGGVWTQIGSDIVGAASMDNFGLSISLSGDGDRVIVGAPSNDDAGTSSGHARIYENVSGSWTQLGSTITGETASDLAGYSVAFNDDGSIVAIGSVYGKLGGVEAGHARVFEFVSGDWIQVGATIDAEDTYNDCGTAVDINADGSVVAVGAPLNNGSAVESGHVRLFSFGPLCIPTSSSISMTECFEYTVPSGDETYTTSGIYNDTITNAEGCDSVMTIDLTINTVDVGVSLSGITISADASGATYQWIDCSDNSPVSGATNQDFTPSSNGDYAVIVTENGCTDTSECITVSEVGIEANQPQPFILHPNPAQDVVYVSGKNTEGEFTILNGLGQVVLSGKITSEIGIRDLDAGLYLFVADSDGNRVIQRLIVE